MRRDKNIVKAGLKSRRSIDNYWAGKKKTKSTSRSRGHWFRIDDGDTNTRARTSTRTPAVVLPDERQMDVSKLWQQRSIIGDKIRRLIHSTLQLLLSSCKPGCKTQMKKDRVPEVVKSCRFYTGDNWTCKLTDMRSPLMSMGSTIGDDETLGPTRGLDRSAWTAFLAGDWRPKAETVARQKVAAKASFMVLVDDCSKVCVLRRDHRLGSSEDEYELVYHFESTLLRLYERSCHY